MVIVDDDTPGVPDVVAAATPARASAATISAHRFLVTARESSRDLRSPRRLAGRAASASISTTSTSPKKNVVGPACLVFTCGSRPTMSGRNWISSAPSTAPQIEPKKPTTAPTSRKSESWIGNVSGLT